MTDAGRESTLLLIQTGGEWPEQNEYLRGCLGEYVKKTVTAAPALGDTPPSGRSSSGQILYRPEKGLAGILAQMLSAKSVSDSDLIVVSDQLIGPLGSLDQLLSDWDQESVEILVRPDSRQDPTESMEFATAELAGPLAMELPWVRVPRKVLNSSAFRTAIAAAAEQSEAELGWLDLHGLVSALGSSAIKVSTAFSGPPDLFARDLETYLRQEIPFLPWALFTSDPLVLERWAVVPRRAFDFVTAKEYPGSLFWNRVLKSCPPQTWYTNLSLLDIFPGSKPRGFTNQLNTAVIVHAFYPEMLAGILKYAGNVPDPVQLFVTTDSQQKKDELEEILSRQRRFEQWEVRVVTTNRGRDVSAFLVDCADVIRDSQFDVVLKLHSKKSVQDPQSVSGWFRDHLFENLLSSRGYVDHIMKEFQEDPQLGIVMPPVIHMGVPTMGNGWTLNKGPAEDLASRIGVDVPFDSFTPLAPYGSMFYARREALLPLVDATFAPDEFPDHAGYKDGSVAHVLERMFSYVVFSQGYYGRCVQAAELAEISAVALQYKYDQVSHYLFPFASRQVRMLGGDTDGALSNAQLRSLIQRQLSARHPKLGSAALTAWNSGKRVARAAKRRLRPN